MGKGVLCTSQRKDKFSFMDVIIDNIYKLLTACSFETYLSQAQNA